MSTRNGRNPTPMGKRPSGVRWSSLAAVVISASRAERSFVEPMWPRPPARVTAIASGAVAEPPIYFGVLVLGSLLGI